MVDDYEESKIILLAFIDNLCTLCIFRYLVIVILQIWLYVVIRRKGPSIDRPYLIMHSYLGSSLLVWPHEVYGAMVSFLVQRYVRRVETLDANIYVGSSL